MKNKIVILTLLLFMLIPFSGVFAEDGIIFNSPNIQLSISNLNLKINDKIDIEYYRRNHFGSEDLVLNGKRLVNPDNLDGKYIETDYLNDDQLSFSNNLILTSRGDGSINSKLYSIKLNDIEIWNSSLPLDYSFESDNIPLAEVTYLKVTETDSQVTLNYNVPTNEDFSHVNIYQDGIKINTSNVVDSSYTVNGLTNDTTYQFKVTTVDINGNESNGVTVSATPTLDDVVPPLEITNLNYSVTDTTVNFNYTLPTDSDFSHLIVTLNGAIHSDNVVLSNYQITGLEPESSHIVKFIAVDDSGNQSDGVIKSFTLNPIIDTEPPESPSNVNVTSYNSGLRIDWTRSSSNDVAGYNVYIDGEKHNSSLIQINAYTLMNLTNEKLYSVQVSAVDHAGNESIKTQSMVGRPTETNLPIFKTSYDLVDVADGVQNWFGSLWLIVAFSVAIPLSFLIAGRIKSLFIA